MNRHGEDAAGQGTTARDRPDVLVHPPVLFAAAAVLGLALDWLAPLWLLAGLDPALRWLLAALFGLPGLVIGALAILRFRRARTAVPTFRAATSLVTDGPYTWSRNPIYVAVVLCYLAVALLLASDWMVLFLVPAVVVLDRGVIAREERYLEAKFGDDYRAYRRRVRRWL